MKRSALASRARWRILGALTVGLILFSTSGWRVPAVLLAALLLLWFACRLPGKLLWRSVRRLSLFLALVVLSFALFSGGGTPSFGFDAGSLVLGLSQAGRILAMVLAMQVARQTGGPGDFVEGLRALGLSRGFANQLDQVMASSLPGNRGRRRGRRVGLKPLLRGDLAPLIELIDRERAVSADTSSGPRRALVPSLAVVAMAVRMVKVVPGLPVAPGHKNVVMVPLFVLAANRSSVRAGATQLGGLVGFASLSLGMGKFGPFDLLKHVAPGIAVDSLSPIAHLMRPSWLGFGLLGSLAALFRLSVQVMLALLIQAPPTLYLLVLPMAVSNAVFGFLGGLVALQLLRGWDERAESRPSSQAQDRHPPQTAKFLSA